ncbi:MAG TPA: hypothetical protein DDZ66_06910 [Firmicutes bacterium]|nr:hypothetical protein [Bacillota bacterium]
MVITRLRCRGLSFFTVVIMLVLIGNVVAREEQTLYVVEGDAIRLDVEGFATLEPPGEPELAPRLTLVRTGEGDDTALYYSLSSLMDEFGNEFPREMVVVMAPSDSEWQAFSFKDGTWRSSDSQICFLTSQQSRSEVFISLRGEVKVRAGTYRGMLTSTYGPDIPIEIAVGPYTVVSGNPQNMHIAVDRGPGWYDADALQVEVEANHGDWVIIISSDGLFYQGDQYKDVPPMQLYVKSDELVPLSKPYEIRGNANGWGTVLTIELKTESSWKHPAGVYKGTILVDVHANK